MRILRCTVGGVLSLAIAGCAAVVLLPQQVLDVAGVPVAVVDDLELSDVLTGEDLPVGTPPP